ncbi:MAG: sulfate/thiosulfate transport system substrate-binding protein [Blastocatellia bacterium]|jgi:sulfate transport system substrate-binding protein|nr:sulfate/thiosulfate transport system substrate-binding protein [Blastocatellia bacterium]
MAMKNSRTAQARFQARREWRVLLVCALFSTLVLSSCLPKPPATNAGSRTITVYGFSVMKESLEKAIFPSFAAKWKQEHGEDVHFVSSFAGSETVTNQIIAGVPADVAILSIERDVDRLQQGGFVTSDWRSFQNRGIVNKTPFVILVRRGNPKGIRDFADLAKPGVKVIHPDPVSSGGAQWSVLAIYGSELKKSEAQTGGRDEARAVKTLKDIWRNVIATPGSAREARTQFETGYGDALITYELEGLLMQQAGAEIEMVVPESTIFSEHPAVIIDRNVTEQERSLIKAFVEYLWSEDAQRAFVKYNFRSITNEALNNDNKGFAEIKMPFTVEYLGGWSRAYPEIIERVFRDQVQKSK